MPDLLEWLAPEPVPAGLSKADLQTMKALGIKPPQGKEVVMALSIVMDLLMKTGSFETDTKRAEKRLRELEKTAKEVGAAVGAAMLAAAAGAAYWVKSSIDAMDSMAKMAQQAGVTVEALSALTYAADLSGVSQEQLGGALVRLSKNMSDAAMGTGDAIRGFEALGISIKNADGSLKSTDATFYEVARQLSQFADGTEKDGHCRFLVWQVWRPAYSVAKQWRGGSRRDARGGRAAWYRHGHRHKQSRRAVQ